MKLDNAMFSSSLADHHLAIRDKLFATVQPKRAQEIIDVASEAAIWMLGAIGLDASDVDEFGNEVSDTVQATLEIAFMRLPVLAEQVLDGTIPLGKN